MVMECISEMTLLFPTGTTMVDSVKTFVHYDMAWIGGIAYWQETFPQRPVVGVNALQVHILNSSCLTSYNCGQFVDILGALNVRADCLFLHRFTCCGHGTKFSASDGMSNPEVVSL